VTGLPNITVSLLPIHGSRTVKDIQRMIASRIALPESSLRLSYGDTILTDTKATLESLDITHSTTLFCELPGAEALSNDVSFGKESPEDSITENIGNLQAEEAFPWGDSCSTNSSTQPAQGQQELNPVISNWNLFFNRRRGSYEDIILVLDFSKFTLQACRIEDVIGTTRPSISRSDRFLPVNKVFK
jgi:hypothetical protein